MVVAQYYNMLRLGQAGYARILKNQMDTAGYLAGKVRKSGRFKMESEAKFMPLITFQLKGKPGFTEYDLSDKLREHGWIVPAYSMPADAESVIVMRVVMKENFSRDMADLFFGHLMESYDKLSKRVKKVRKLEKKGSRVQGIC